MGANASEIDRHKRLVCDDRSQLSVVRSSEMRGGDGGHYSEDLISG